MHRSPLNPTVPPPGPRLALCALFAGLAILAVSAGVAQSQPATKTAGAAPGAPAAPATVHTVRYSYEKWSRVGEPRYVLTPRSVEIPAGGLADRVRELFRLLVTDKRNSYGQARIAFKDDAAATGIVYVYLDDAKANLHPIVMAETTHTFTENGASKVIFPRFNETGWTRADVPFPAYVLELPVWQALPPATVGGALVVLPDGARLPSELALQRLGSGDKALVDAVWSYVKQGPPAAALGVVRAAPSLKLKDLEARLLPVLESANAALRIAALDGLAGSETPVVSAALRKVMDSDPDPALRDKAAGLLSGSKDPAVAVAAQIHALRSKDPEAVIAAARSLATSKQPEAGTQLQEKLGHPDAGVRAAVIAAILARGEHGALASRLAESALPVEVRVEAARALAAGEDAPARVTAWQFLAVEGKGADSARAAAALGNHSAKATFEALAKAVRHAEPATRRAAAGALGALKDTQSLELLAAADVDDDESGEAMLEAIRTIYAEQDIDAVLRATRNSNPVLKRAAVATLGDIALTAKGKRYRKTIIETLQPLAKGNDALIRASTARSFAAMAGDDVRGDMLELAADDAVEVQRAVARVLPAFPGPETTRLLLGFAESKDSIVLANALESLGTLKSTEALNSVLPYLGHKEARVRRAATRALVALGAELEMSRRKPLLAYFSERVFDQDPEVRIVAVNGLVLVEDKGTVTVMSALIQDPDPTVRVAALGALTKTGEASAVETILLALEDGDRDVRRAALDGLATLKSKAAVTKLTEYAAAETDKELAAEAKQLLGTLR